MRKFLLFLLTFIALAISSKAQDDAKILKIKQILKTQKLTPAEIIKYARQGLSLARQSGRQKDELSFLTNLQFGYYYANNYPKQLEVCFDGLELSRSLHRDSATVFYLNLITIAYDGGNEPRKAIDYGIAGLKFARKINYKSLLGPFTNNIARQYKTLNLPDSAFYYMQQAYVYSKANAPHTIGYPIVGLGDIENMRNQPQAALAYYRQAIKPFAATNDLTNLGYTYFNIAKLLQRSGAIDSAFHYANLSYALAVQTNDLDDIVGSCEALSALYEGKNDKESLRYYKIATEAKEKRHSAEQAKELQTLTLKEQQRQVELSEKIEKEKEEAKQNLQLIIIAFFIPIFLFVVLLLSRTRTHRRVIDFMAVLSLLLLFEFITLLIHPQVEKITHHTPILELLILVGLAALLVPLHHEATHWLKKKLSAHS